MIGNGQIFLRLIIALLLGGLIGFEREKHNKRIAGFRTHIIVCVGACLIMLTSIHMFELYGQKAPLDPARIAAGVITGIGFLGAGTIIRSRASIMGLTTAASLWTVSGVGLAVGCGFYPAAFFATIIVFATLYMLGKIPIDEKEQD